MKFLTILRNAHKPFFPAILPFRTQDPYCFVILPIREGLHPSLWDDAPLGLNDLILIKYSFDCGVLPLLKERVGERWTDYKSHPVVDYKSHPVVAG